MGKGLEGIVAAATAISYIDGINGRLFYRGIDINELAQQSTFMRIGRFRMRSWRC